MGHISVWYAGRAADTHAISHANGYSDTVSVVDANSYADTNTNEHTHRDEYAGVADRNANQYAITGA
jgi:hypothetical protein